MVTRVASVLQVLGLVAIVAGMALVAPALGVIGGGVALVVTGLAIERGGE